jgi:hypothetical protein
MQIQEASVVTGYAETSPDRNSWNLKAPNTAGIAIITPGASGITLNQSSHNPVTLGAVGSSPNANAASISGSQVLNLQPADSLNPGVVTNTSQTFSGNKTFSGTTNLSGLTASLPLQLDGSKNVSNITGSGNQLVGFNAAGTATEVKTISGTANQVSVAQGIGSITLSTPQNIATSSSPTFAGLTVGSLSGIVHAASGVLSASAVSLTTDVSGVLPTTNGGTGQNSTATFPTSGTVAVVPGTGVVHSNGSALSASQVVLTSEVSGFLPKANGGSAQDNSSITFPASGILGTVPASGVVHSNGSVLSSSNVSLTAEVSGVLPIANGGTNSSAALSGNRIIISSATAHIEQAAITASRALASDTNGLPVASATTATELGYVSGVTSAIQTQLNGKPNASAGDINETSFSFLDNQVTAQNITSFAFANATVRAFSAIVSIVRNSTYASYELKGIQKAASWEMDQTFIGDTTGLTFSITNAGQIQYTSTSTGSGGTLKFRAITVTV